SVENSHHPRLQGTSPHIAAFIALPTPWIQAQHHGFPLQPDGREGLRDRLRLDASLESDGHGSAA
ncbi:hypothetical protein, partial [Spirillospora sp. NPDC048823]|uniref:hypothetical protein n=1 Tax=unclassified Spirillospora TaxID=2642701 RepID=UPI00371E502C